MQPPPKDKSLSLWSNADEINRVNGECHTNTLHLEISWIEY